MLPSRIERLRSEAVGACSWSPILVREFTAIPFVPSNRTQAEMIPPSLVLPICSEGSNRARASASDRASTYSLHA